MSRDAAQTLVALSIFGTLALPIAYACFVRYSRSIPRPQFRIRTLLVIVAVAAVAFWVWTGFLWFCEHAG